MAVTPADIRDAARRIAPTVHRTPVLTSRLLDERCGCRVFLKCENFQRGGAFKLRGAANFVATLTPDELSRGVMAYSSGNHAQAVAIAAARAGARATLVMPIDAPKSKVDATAALGGEIVRYDRFNQDREAICGELSRETGATTIPPYDHPLTIAGQGTAALELLEDVPGLEALIAPIGGGGLLAGSAIIGRDINPKLRVFGAEPADANDTFLSLAAGKRIGIPPPESIADGLRSPMPGALTFPVLQQYVEAIALVNEAEIRESVKFLLSRLKILVEPSGAVPVAALLYGKLAPLPESIGVIVSGGNVDLEQLAAICG